MFKHLTYKQKFKWLGAVAIVSLFICWQLSIRRDVAEAQVYHAATEAFAGGESGEGSLGQLKQKDKELTRLYSRFVLDTLVADKNLLSIASNYCKNRNIRLKEYKAVSLASDSGRQILTRAVTVEGGFIPCLQLLNELEVGSRAGRVSGAVFRSSKDAASKRLRLNCTIYVQNVLP